MFILYFLNFYVHTIAKNSVLLWYVLEILFPADLVTFTEEIINENFIFCAVLVIFPSECIIRKSKQEEEGRRIFPKTF